MAKNELALFDKMRDEIVPKQQKKELAIRKKDLKKQIKRAKKSKVIDMPDGEYFFDRKLSFPYQEGLYFAKMIKNKSHVKLYEFYGNPNKNLGLYIKHENWNEKFFQKHYAETFKTGFVPMTPVNEKLFKNLLKNSKLIEEYFCDYFGGGKDVSKIKSKYGECELCGELEMLRTAEVEGEEIDLCDTCASNLFTEDKI